ncbi:MAG: bacteriohemerythrin, partial [Selenomonas sp.]
PAAKHAAKTAAPKAAKPTTTVIKAKNAPADPFAFTDEFRTQIPLVDKEHETLFDLVRQTYNLVHDEFCVDKFDGIVEIIEELRNYTIKHFADEERYMKSIDYDGLPEQVAAHTAFVEKLNNIDLDEIDRDQEDALDKLIKFLLNWLVQHILKVDKKMPYIEEAALKLTE